MLYIFSVQANKTVEVVSIINQKGGVGKTTTAINLSAQLAKTHNKKVLVIDLDPQANLTIVLSGGQFEFNTTIADVFDAPKKNPLLKSIIPAQADGEPIQNLYLCPSDISLSRVIEQSLTKFQRERILLKQLEPLKNDFDIVILDCPPNMSLTSVNAMVASDLFLIPIDGGSFSLNGLADLLDALEEVKESEQVNYAVFRNEYSASNKLINNFIEGEFNALEGKVLKTKIRRSEAIGQASVMTKPLLSYNQKSNVIYDYKQLSQELIEFLNV
jgi:chromosome partitioning protein